VRKEEPAKYLALAIALVPKDLQVSVSGRLPGGLDADDWAIAMECLRAIRDALPDAHSRPPGEVMGFVLDAIRSHTAIEVGCIEKPPENSDCEPQ